MTIGRVSLTRRLLDPTLALVRSVVTEGVGVLFEGGGVSVNDICFVVGKSYKFRIAYYIVPIHYTAQRTGYMGTDTNLH